MFASGCLIVCALFEVNQGNSGRCTIDTALDQHILKSQIIVDLTDTMQFLKAIDEPYANLASRAEAELLFMFVDELVERVTATLLHHDKRVQLLFAFYSLRFQNISLESHRTSAHLL